MNYKNLNVFFFLKKNKCYQLNFLSAVFKFNKSEKIGNKIVLEFYHITVVGGGRSIKKEFTKSKEAQRKSALNFRAKLAS